ncbi:uncharacterized protein LOC119829139 [Zerene cesonia]|uniref:uncharacterized protein LOC119829139 n=1 Tax=Zerene cesonia TaxID=33412 RepID=UPI0018E4E7EA|nr:uncharacterized protein LOC119829139 [Zerene cesonia]
MFQKLLCKIVCFVKKSVREEGKLADITGYENVISVPFLITEIVFLGLTIAFLNKYKQIRSKDRLDELLQDSRDALQQTNEFLEKWRLRRVKTEYSYLDEEPQEIKPYKLEVPILHMAIIDTLGTTRSRPERGDAGDTINITDSTLLSVTSLLDEDYEAIPEPISDERFDDSMEKCITEFKNRYLWDVVEEDD